MVEHLVLIHHQNQALVLPWLVCSSCLCINELAIKMHLWVYGCWCIEEKGSHGNNFLAKG